tara:strand:- start:12 stop:689 length:678 start_codon:yes stop_codon:yes gene_type:complete
MTNKKKSIVSIITARKNSKRLKNKNLRKILGFPLIHYAIISSLNSKFISATYVATDDQKISDYSKKLGAKVPFLRDKKYSKDGTSSFQTISNFFKKLDLKIKPDLVILLQPTSPLRTTRDIDDSIKLLKRNKSATSIVSVVKTPNMFLNKNSLIKSKINFKFNKDIKNEKIYSTNGAIYIVPYKNIFKKNPFGKSIQIYEMKLSKSIDIDTMDDLLIAKALINKN